MGRFTRIISTRSAAEYTGLADTKTSSEDNGNNLKDIKLSLNTFATPTTSATVAVSAV